MSQSLFSNDGRSPGEIFGLKATPVALKPLPEGIAYTVAFRRAVRVGDVAGTGIAGHMRRSLTKQDLTEHKAELLEFCGRRLASGTLTDLEIRTTQSVLEIETTNLDRVDLYVDGHPEKSLKTGSRFGTRTVTHEFQTQWDQAEVVGHARDFCRQRRLMRPAGVQQFYLLRIESRARVSEQGHSEVICGAYWKQNSRVSDYSVDVALKISAPESAPARIAGSSDNPLLPTVSNKHRWGRRRPLPEEFRVSFIVAGSQHAGGNFPARL